MMGLILVVALYMVEVFQLTVEVMVVLMEVVM